jgi:hypothetical protein
MPAKPESCGWCYGLPAAWAVIGPTCTMAASASDAWVNGPGEVNPGKTVSEAALCLQGVSAALPSQDKSSK